jgi:hypothetical protein
MTVVAGLVPVVTLEVIAIILVIILTVLVALVISIVAIVVALVVLLLVLSVILLNTMLVVSLFSATAQGWQSACERAKPYRRVGRDARGPKRLAAKLLNEDARGSQLGVS